VHKGLQAYNQFVCGWVKDVCIQDMWKVFSDWSSEQFLLEFLCTVLSYELNIINYIPNELELLT